MPAIARIGDTFEGYCNIHNAYVTGEIIGGSEDTFGNTKKIARVGDEVLGSCGHTSVIVSGSPDVFVNNIPVARVGDDIDGNITGTIITGSPDVFVN